MADEHRESRAPSEVDLSIPSKPVEAVLTDVRRVDWQAWAIPRPDRLFDYDSSRVVPAFEAFAQATSPGEADLAYNLFLDAVAHNHSGTPYAAMAPAAPLLSRLVPHLGAGAAEGMEALTCCVAWTFDGPAFTGPDGVECDLAGECAEAARALAPLANSWRHSGDESRRRAAAGLLEVLAELDG